MSTDRAALVLARSPASARSRSPAASRASARISAAASWTCGSGETASTSATRPSHWSTAARSPRSRWRRASAR